MTNDSQSSDSEKSSGKQTILVVDDEVSVLNFVSYVLKKEGYEVLSAEGGYAAYQILEKRNESLGEIKIDLILIDWAMPGWNGLKLLTEIRLRPYQGVPVILMSGAITREELVNAARNRADAVLVKPVSKEALVPKVIEVIERRKVSQSD